MLFDAAETSAKQWLVRDIHLKFVDPIFLRNADLSRILLFPLVFPCHFSIALHSYDQQIGAKTINFL
jgi:hypothetical protein